ncbi:MAG: tRNA (guanosine(37)-N1)-methyltransferase TrmD [Verrucomicrobiota bacterium]
MKIDLITLFPEMVPGITESSIIQRAAEAGLVETKVTNLRDFAQDKHRTVDDRPFGGGPGMVLKCEPLVEAIETLRGESETPAHVVYMTPEGRVFDQKMAQRLSSLPRLIFVSGHYEGIDERVREGWIDEEVSVGDYVLTNGTLPALVVIDAITRLIPGVLGNEASAGSDSFSDGILEGPQYTRPEEFRGSKVPDVLLSGNHGAIEKWRNEMAQQRTRERRPELEKEDESN